MGNVQPEEVYDMALAGDGFTTGPLSRPFPGAIQQNWRALAHRRLSRAWETAVVIPYDDSSRLVFMSDCHRGDGSAADAFVRNKRLYLTTLARYLDQGFTYVEVGDGDELWQNGRFSDIQQAHQAVFELLHAFEKVGRLYLLIGNHDTFSNLSHQVDKDGIPTHKSLLLRHRRNEQTGPQILVLHGHQADLTSSHFYAFSRLLCRSLWRQLQMRQGVRRLSDSFQSPEDLRRMQARRIPFASQGKRIENLIIEWVARHNQPLICGHTHLPTAAASGAPPYFNCGSCVSNGYITGLEIDRGEIVLVKWILDCNQQLQRLPLARPRRLEELTRSGSDRQKRLTHTMTEQ